MDGRRCLCFVLLTIPLQAWAFQSFRSPNIHAGKKNIECRSQFVKIGITSSCRMGRALSSFSLSSSLVPSQDMNHISILASKDKESLTLFRPIGAKPHAAHLAKLCQKADSERRFLSEEELETLFREPDIASGIRRLLSRFEAELPTVFVKISADLDDAHPDRTCQLSPEEWIRWGQLVQYIILSARGDEHDNNDLQGVVDTVERLVDRWDPRFVSATLLLRLSCHMRAP